jgi:hypothetical protein
MWTWYFYSAFGSATPALIRQRLTVIGTGVERLTLEGTGAKRMNTEGTGTERLTVEGVR